MLCDLLGDTHGVAALADERLAVVLALWAYGDELKGVGPRAELAVRWLHPVAGAVGQVQSPNRVLRGHEHSFNYRGS